MSEGLSLRANMLWNTAGAMTRLGCNYLVTIAVVRLSHGFDAAGALSLAMSISNLVMPFADFRLRQIQVTDVTNERSAGEYVGLRIMTTVLSFVVGVVYAIVTTAWDALPVITLYLLYSLAANGIELLHAVDQRHRRMDYIGRSYMMQGVGTLAAFCAVLPLTNSLVLAVASQALVTLLIGLLYDLPRASSFESLHPVVRLGAGIRLLVSLVPVVGAQIAASSVLTVPRQHLASSLGVSALGIYSSVATLAVVIQAGINYLYSPLMGEFAELFQSDKVAARRMLAKTVGAIVAMGVVLSVLLLFLGGPLLRLMYGEQIARYVYLLQPALICTFAAAVAWFMNDLLLALRDFRASFWGNIVAALAMLVSSSALVESFGMNGVSFVGIVAYGASVVTLVLFFIRDYRRLPS